MDHEFDHPLRRALVDELHARPSPRLEVPCHAVMVAFKEPQDAASRQRSGDIAHLNALLERNTIDPVPDGTSHINVGLGRYQLKWESFTEFVSYTAFGPGIARRSFEPSKLDIFPDDWVSMAPAKRLTSVVVRVEDMPEDTKKIEARLAEWFVSDSLVAAEVIDGAAVVASDFRIDANGHMRFAVFVKPGTGPGRIGRVVQRLLDIEVYRAMSMLGLKRARDLTRRLNTLDPQLTALVNGISDDTRAAEDTLHELITVSSELESAAAQMSFRFGATPAYAAIVHERIGALREQRFAGRQTFTEFMTRRYEPAMRTVRSAEARLHTMLERATRAGELLRTRVDVDRARQNQRVLESMNQRADLQLRMQETVEGLSVVAISYYAVSLVGYMLYPAAKAVGLSKEIVLAGVVPLVVLGVWLMVRRIRKRIH